MSEIPESKRRFYVTEAYELVARQRVSEFVAGPFDHPDEARNARDFMRHDAPSRCVQCVEVVSFNDDCEVQR